MHPSEYGPFANVVAVACALVATFGFMLLKMLGGIRRWTWLSVDTPAFLVAAGARVLSVALMAAIYVTIDTSNYRWFAIGAVVAGISGFLSVRRFDRLRRRHVLSIPLVGPDGQPLLDKRKRVRVSNVAIAAESQLQPEAAEALKQARKDRGGVSLQTFVSGYGGQALNDPAALWDRNLLADIAGQLSTSLIYVVLFAVITLFLASFVVSEALATR